MLDRMKVFLVLALLLPTAGLAADSACPVDSLIETLPTRLGTVSVARQKQEPYSINQLVVKEATVFTADDPYISLCAAFDVDTGVAVLFRSSPGGLNIDRFYFLLLSRGKK